MDRTYSILLSGLLSLFLASSAGAQVVLERLTAPTHVTGRVFVDGNGNGTFDAGDRPLTGVSVSDQIQEVFTASDGTFALDARGYGVVFASQPDSFRARGAFWRRISGATAQVEFPMERAPSGGDFIFLHASDIHLDTSSLPRLHRLRAMIDSIQPAFVLLTGDLVRDALRVPEETARGYYDLLTRELADFPVPVYTVPGNHEIFGIERASSLVSPDHPLYGDRMYRSYLGPEYYSFSYGGVRFLGLNTVDYLDQWYNGHVDSLQVAWIAGELERGPADEPIVIFSHMPFVSAGEARSGYAPDGPAPSVIRVDGVEYFRHNVRNHRQVLGMIGPRLEIALAGHIHIRESITYVTQGGPQRLHTAAAVVGPVPGPDAGPDAAYGAISGITLYRVHDGHVDDGTFLPLAPPPDPSPGGVGSNRISRTSARATYSGS